MTHEPLLSRTVCDVVAEADRQRRTRTSVKQLARLAPIVAAVGLGLALVGRLTGWSPFVAIGLLAAAGLALASIAWWMRRPRVTSDAIAESVDADANLRGELRSAHWFASQDRADEWVDYHLAKAVEHVQTVSWSAVYPPVAAPRAWWSTSVLVLGALAVSIVIPRRQVVLGASGAQIDAVAESAAALPPELQKTLQALLAGMKDGSMSDADVQASLEKLKDLATLDPALQKKLQDLAEARKLDQAPQKKKDGTEGNADEANQNSNGGMNEESRWAAEDQASKAANAEANRNTNEKNSAATEASGEKGLGSKQAETAQATQSDPSMKMMRDAATDAAASQMTMGGAAGSPSGDSKSGAGGNSPNDKGRADAALIAQALKQELLEANTDTKGANITKEDIRRKTEESRSTMGYSKVAPVAQFDKSRSAAPPQVPEARRSLLQSYFVRRPPG